MEQSAARVHPPPPPPPPRRRRALRGALAALVPYAAGGIAGCLASTVVHPADLLKTRMQIEGELRELRALGRPARAGAFTVLRRIVSAEGVGALYSGISASWLRQLTYASARLGSFHTFKSLLQTPLERETGQFTLGKRLLSGSLAGVVGSLFGNPADVALIRMMADGRLPADLRRNYRHVGDALFSMVRSEGAFVMYRGLWPTMLRAVALNATQLGIYDQAKCSLLRTGFFSDNILLHASSSMLSAFVSSIASLPFDLAKTRLQNMHVVYEVIHSRESHFVVDIAAVRPRRPYRGTLHCMLKIVKYESFPALWRGFPAYFLKLGPHTVLTFIFLEQLLRLARVAGVPT